MNNIFETLAQATKPETMSTTVKHTPGPWEISEVPDSNRIYDKAGNHIADSTLSKKGVPWIQYRDEQAANSKLIAAAPELLDNEKTNLSTCQSLIIELKAGRVDFAIETIKRMITDTEAAIKKATDNEQDGGFEPDQPQRYGGYNS